LNPSTGHRPRQQCAAFRPAHGRSARPLDANTHPRAFPWRLPLQRRRAHAVSRTVGRLDNSPYQAFRVRSTLPLVHFAKWARCAVAVKKVTEIPGVTCVTP
jgi:hypothetical protein